MVFWEPRHGKTVNAALGAFLTEPLPRAAENDFLSVTVIDRPHLEYLIRFSIIRSQRERERKVMSREERLTEKEEVNLKNALEHIGELEHLMKRRPLETFRSLLKLNIPMELEIEIEGGTYAVTFNDSD